MLTLDLVTLMLVTGLVIVLSGIFFVLNTIMGNNDVTGRLWGTSFIMAMMGVVASAAWSVEPSAWWVLPISNAALIASVGATWAGSRTFNSKASWLAIPLAAAVAAAVVTIVEFSTQGVWAGASTLYAVLALFAGLTAAESASGAMGKRLNGRMLAAVTVTASLFYLGRFIAFFAWGPQSELFSFYFGSDVTTIVLTLVVLGSALTMSVLQAERGLGSNAWRRDANTAFSQGVLEWRMFLNVAGDRIDRSAEHGNQTVVIVGHLDNLPEINLAFGRQLGDEAIASFARLLRAELPPTAVIGHRGAGRMAVVSDAASAEEARRVAARILNALVDSPIDYRRGGFRLSASFGVAHSSTSPHVLTLLLSEAEAACDRARDSGGNRVVIAAGGKATPVVGEPTTLNGDDVL